LFLYDFFLYQFAFKLKKLIKST